MEGMRGRPKMVNILETTMNFLDRPFESVLHPLRLTLPPSAAVGAALPDCSLRLVVGFTRSLASKMLLQLVLSSGLSADEIGCLMPQIKAAIVMHAVVEIGSEEQLLQRSLLSKFQVAESTRPDVLQIYEGFVKYCARAGLKYAEAISDQISRFNMNSSTDTSKISEQEEKMLRMLPNQDELFLKLLSSHWDNFKAGESGATLRTLVTHCDRVLPRDDTKPAIWTAIMAPSPAKNLLFLQRLIEVYMRNFKDAIKGGKKVNLAFRAARLREQAPADAYNFCCLYQQFLPQFKQQLSDGQLKAATAAFVKGAYDKEFLAQVRALDAEVSCKSFRFVSLLQGKATSLQSLEQQQENAESEAEAAQLKAFTVKLQKEQGIFLDFKSALKDFHSKHAASHRDHLLQQKRDLEAASRAYQENWMPIRVLERDDFVTTTIQNIVTDFAQKQSTLEEHVYKCLWCDLTKLGAAHSKHLMTMVSILAENVAAMPAKTVALIAVPNTATWGSVYSEAEILKAVATVEETLRSQEAELLVRRAVLSFSEESLKGSTRPGWHDVLVAISKVENAQGELVSDFTKSYLWQRRHVHDVEARPVGQFVVPDLQLQTGALNSSKAQRSKQQVTGVDLFLKLQQVLWRGVQTFGKSCIWFDLTPYDASLAQSVTLKNAQGKQDEPESTQSVAQIIFATDDSGADNRKVIFQYITAVVRQQIQKLAKEDKILKLDGFVERNFEAEKMPSYDEKHFELCMVQTQEGGGHCLLLREAALEKLVFNRYKQDFDKLVALHNSQHNPSGQSFKEKKRTATVAQLDLDKEPKLQCPPVEKTKDDLDKPLVVLPATSISNFEIVIDAKKQVFLLSNFDGVVTHHRPLFLGWGEYRTAGEVEKREKAKAMMLPFKMDTPEYKAFFFHDSTTFTPGYPEAVSSLADFLRFLEGKGVVKPSIACHALEVVAGATDKDCYKVNNDKLCSFELKPVPPKSEVTYQNGGSLLKVQKQEIGKLKIMMRLKFTKSESGAGIYPQKPGFFLAQPLSVAKGQMYQLV
ncbi:unnamed protein product [Effrenium voratum]|uniref:Uncharacterized protein n=1 Tax=Effrenium voratum TaxID=2562239 RepID=A0AA36NEI2_9DINO|nr:unnamed protein product [Effrenium voratum]CAJ1457101.1 unnamed protein product [Effrenium voratum]